MSDLPPPDEFQPLGEMIAATARAAPDRPALKDEARALTYGELDAAMDRVGAALQRDGVGAGDTIAVCGEASVAYVAAFLGAVRIGVAVAPLPPSSTPASLAAMLADSQAKALFADATTRALFDRPFIALDRLADWLAPEGARPAAVAIAPDAVFNTIYSSGTTGTPKGIDQSHAMRFAHTQRRLIAGYDEESVTLASTPLYSNTTLVAVLPTLAAGGRVVLMKKFDARRFLEIAQAERATHAMLVPVQYARLLALPDFDRFDLTSFRMKLATSAPFAAALKAEVLARWPGGLTEYYGMTEGGGTCILLAHERPDKLHTVGQPALGHDIRLIDEEGREVGPGGTGEIVGRSPAMMNAYRNAPDKTREAEWRDAQGRRFIRTGDIGRFDDEGFLTLLDRRKDMIISGGFNVFPSDIEAALLASGLVREAAVVGAPSALWGETPVGFVVLKQPTDPEALRTHVNASLGKTQRLAALRVVEALPRSAIGKVLKRELREAAGAMP
ncbi:MAG: acyl--CoA ligase [Pseudomonadota bacterium]|nr:acyl--CoA ligase [Pseudomonadota bacterium]